MNTKIIAAAALGGLALAVVPAAVAFGANHGIGALDRLTTGLQDSSRDRLHSAPRTPAGGMGMMGGWDSDAGRGSDASGRGASPHGTMSGGTTAGGNMMGGRPDDDAAVELVDGTISDADAAALAFMVEEEKLAHDLYVELGDAWNLRVFEMISGAEETHTAPVAALLDAYGLDNPTDGADAGEFTDPVLQDLYDTLLEQGLASEVDALKVGALVEETDILDLQSRATDEASIALVFDRLESGSDHHLRAFVSNLERLGVTYVPQVLPSSEVDAIVGR